MDKILVVGDYTEHTQVAIEQAKELAALFKARLHIVHFCHVDLKNETQDAERIREQVTHAVYSQAETLLSHTLGKSVGYNHEVVWTKHIHSWVQDYVAAEKPCLVVKTGHRTESAIYTPTDWHLLRECTAPVWIAPETKWKRASNVLAALDLEARHEDKQALNHKILDYARKCADFYQTELHVCYSPSAPLVLQELGIKNADEVEQAAIEKCKALVQELAEKYDIPEERFHIKAGQAEKVIPSVAAKAKAGLVVMGTIGRKGLNGKLIGNTAEKVLSLLKADVLALKPDEH